VAGVRNIGDSLTLRSARNARFWSFTN